MSEVIRDAPVETTPAVEAPAAPVDTSGSSEIHLDGLLVTYQDDQGKPWAAKYLEIDDVWKDQPELKLEVETIEGFLRDQVSKNRLDNSIRAAEKYLKEIEKKSGSNPYDSTNQRITKILAYIDFLKVVHS